MRRKIGVLLIAAFIISVHPAPGQKFRSDDPIRSDDDRLDTPQQPARIALSDMYDRFGHTFRDFGESPIGSEAVNVNTLDEAPDSSWFTNRHGARRMSLDDLRRGPNHGNAPDPSETWQIYEGKSQGLTPGFEIRDEKGERYVIKLDPVDVPELSSAAEVIATKIFYAIGYNVPENYIVRYDPADLEIEPGTMVEDQFGDDAPLTDWRFRRMIRRVPRLDDGTMRVTASKYLPGLPLGPFHYFGARSDDPNDIFPHEDRRELRGLRLIAAWLNHDDTRAHNTQDTWVEENGRHYIRHYLLDFGSTFGSGSVVMQYPYLTFNYWLDLEQVKRNLLGFGFVVPAYRHVKWPEFPEYQAVGRWESARFDPEGWRNDYPNPAFVRMTARDAFWAAKLIMSFTPEELRAIVETGEYSHPELAEYFLQVLIERQEKCGRFGFSRLNPLDEFQVTGNVLEFTNLAQKHGFVDGATRYRVSWSVYDNANGTNEPLGEPATLSETRVSLPSRVVSGNAEDDFWRVEIHSLHDDHPEWDRAVHVYLRSNGVGYEVVGIDRES
ncbi:MAG: hypothetical protein ACRD1X_06585 [Vicinamibacteria bacterium]